MIQSINLNSAKISFLLKPTLYNFLVICSLYANLNPISCFFKAASLVSDTKDLLIFDDLSAFVDYWL